MATEKTKPVVKLQLGTQAISFPLPVTITKLDGTEAVVTFTCKAQRKTEWAQAKDSYQATQLQNKTAHTNPDAIAAKAAAHAPADTPADTPADAANSPAADAVTSAGQAADTTAELPATTADQPADKPADQPFDYAAFFAKHGMQSLVQLGLEADAGLALKAATDWDLSDEFNAANLQRMEDEFAGSLSQLVHAYDIAIFQGRLGNLKP